MNKQNTNQTPDKPLSVYIQETKQNLINAINNCGLHVTLIEMIMKDIYSEVKQQADLTHQRELEQYQQALTEQETSKED